MVFADTLYFLAMLNPGDQHHSKAMALAKSVEREMVTTAWVLTELGDAMCRPPARQSFARFLDQLKVDSFTTVLPPSREVFENGLALYLDRPDKSWSLTDCISFYVMRDIKIIEALTADHHFTQAGFRILM